MTTTAVWHGSAQESFELTRILSAACTCEFAGAEVRGCAGHEMLFNQRVIDGLLFARRIVAQLASEEFGLPATGDADCSPFSL